MEVTELLNRLESNQPQIVEETKKIFHENFNATKESWLVVGLFDYYLYTSSVRSVEILVGVREPHDKHLFDKILEALKGSSKLQALTLLGHVVRRQPTWLYKITQHPLMKELIKVLKTEIDIMPLMSALLVLIVLLPMLPALIGPFLPDIFEVFSRLAAWKCTNPNKLPEEHLLHLQVALYALFHRLYGMYPCNFLSYMRSEYSRHENLGTFSHTIKPMLDSVKMHPLLVTHSKEGETTAQRWKSMEHHDVILECAKFSLDTERSTLRSRPALELSHHPGGADGFHSLAIAAQSPAVDADLWSPSVHCGIVTPPPPQAQETAAAPIPQTPNSQSYVVSASLPHQEGTSPPEAAIEATPETTPIKDLRNVMGRPTPPINSSVVRALNTFGGSKWPGVTSNSTTPSQSQPSSPMKKDPSAPSFTFPSEATTPTSAFEQPRRDSLFQAADPRREFVISQKVQKVLHERNQMTTESPPVEKLAMNLRPRSSGAAPTSPLRIIGSAALCVPNSPVPMDPTAPVPGGKVSRPTPEKNGFRFDTVGHDSTQEDREVFEIVRQGEQLLMDSQPRPVPVVASAARQCDSVLHDIHGPHADDYEECPQDSGSPCTSGGLHMPNSRSMLDFARRVALQHRQRYYSQCVPDHAASTSAETFSAGSSPGDGVAFLHVRRANSCPEMKKVPALPAADVVKGKVLHEREELEMDDPHREWHMTNGKGAVVPARSKAAKKLSKKEMASTSTQTIDYWAPFPYEHLFLEVLPSVEHNGDVKAMPYAVSSPAPLERQHRDSPYAMLDKYIDTVAQAPPDGKRAKGQGGADAEARTLREQIFLLNVQLQFERHRREVHAERNRRLLGKSRSTRAMEEHNMALREQLSLLQTDIEQLHIETDKKKREFHGKELKFQENIVFWQHQCNALTKEVKDLNMSRKVLEQEVKTAREKTGTVEKECQRVEKELFDVVNDMRHALSAASAGARLRANVEHLQKELLLMGELQQRYREHAAQRPLLPRHDEDELAIVRDSGKAEITALSELLESKSSTLEASRSRVTELETVVTRRDMLIAEQKRTLKLVKEEYHDQLEAVESKCETQRAINQRMEEQVMFLTNQLEELERGRIARSPDSSAHEASVSSAGSANRLLGLSPPLAESLRDRAQHQWPGGDAVGMRSLQLIAEQPEQRQPTYEPIGYAEPGTSGEG